MKCPKCDQEVRLVPKQDEALPDEFSCDACRIYFTVRTFCACGSALDGSHTHSDCGEPLHVPTLQNEPAASVRDRLRGMVATRKKLTIQLIERSPNEQLIVRTNQRWRQNAETGRPEIVPEGEMNRALSTEISVEPAMSPEPEPCALPLGESDQVLFIDVDKSDDELAAEGIPIASFGGDGSIMTNVPGLMVDLAGAREDLNTRLPEEVEEDLIIDWDNTTRRARRIDGGP